MKLVIKEDAKTPTGVKLLDMEPGELGRIIKCKTSEYVGEVVVRATDHVNKKVVAVSLSDGDGSCYQRAFCDDIEVEILAAGTRLVVSES